MRSRHCLPFVLVLAGACGGDGDAVRSARAAIAAGDLARAERVLVGVEGSAAADVRGAIAKVHVHRGIVDEQLAAILAELDAATPNQLRERLKQLRDAERDPVARDKIAETLSNLAELLARRASAPRAESAEAQRESARAFIGRVRGDVREALDAQAWQRAEALLVMLADQPRELVGELGELRARIASGASAESARLLGQAAQIEREQGARSAFDWLAAQAERFPGREAFDELHGEVRELGYRARRAALVVRDEPVDPAAAGDESEPDDDPRLAVARAVPEALDSDGLIALARQSALDDDLAFARQCWLAASRKLFPGDLRDDCVGEAQDLRARITLRSELIEAFRARPEVFANLGIERVDALGWSEAGTRSAWRDLPLDGLQRAVALLDLSRAARRGVVCEALRASAARESERAVEELAHMVERGDIDGADAANIVARARGGIGAAERFLLEHGRWVTREASASAQLAAQESELEQAFLRARPEQRGTAFDALTTGATEVSVRRALSARTQAAHKALERGAVLDQLRALAALREELDRARKDALKLIFDERVYFYPYEPPEPPNTPGDYAKAQRRVDELVAAVRAVWERTKTVKLSKEFRAAVDEFAWCRDAHGQLGVEFRLPQGVGEYVLAQDPALAEVELASFAWDAREADDLGYSRAVLARNEELWAAAALKTTSLPAASVPSEAERRQVQITNAYRMLMGRRALAWNPRIQDAAQGHSEYMANTGDFGHFEQGDRKRRTPFDRMQLAGYQGGVSENCAMVGGDPQTAHDGWLHSSGHHRNILMEGHREMASGVASSYWTQNFGVGSAFTKELKR